MAFIKVQARDSFGYYSPWSDPLEVEMPVYYGGGPVDDPDPGNPDPGYPDPGYPDPDEPDDPGYPFI